MKRTILIAFLLTSLFTHAQEGNQNAKIVLITLDGLRWQELFTGADEALISNDKYVKHSDELKTLFWKKTPQERRKALLPFVWSTLKNEGQIHGNRKLGSKVNLTNKYWFSYPGYNEILTGIADDDRIKSNDKILNPNYTILEITQKTKQYNNKVAAFCSWDVFPSIINESRSNVLVNAGFSPAKGNDLTPNEKYLNKLQKVTPSPWHSVRLDTFTHHYAMEYMKKSHPDLLYIAYGDTDDFAHDGNYEAYLKSAKTTDEFIKEIWTFIQNDPYYKNNTTVLITTDHGRGVNPIETWSDHGDKVKGSDQVWLMALGKGIPAKGEISTKKQLYSNQIAATIAKFLAVNMDNNKVGKAINFTDSEYR